MGFLEVVFDSEKLTIQGADGAAITLPIQRDQGVRIVVRDELRLEFSPGTTAPLPSESAEQPQPPKSEGQPPRASNVQKKAADYVEELLLSMGVPLTTSQIAELLPKRTDYVNNSRDLANTLRTAMNREPERFEKHGKGAWRLVEQGDRNE